MTSAHDPETPGKMNIILREGEDSGTVAGVAVRYLFSPASGDGLVVDSGDVKTARVKKGFRQCTSTYRAETGSLKDVKEPLQRGSGY